MPKLSSPRVKVLAVVNAALLLTLSVVAFAPRAIAQDAMKIDRASGEYILVGGEINSGNSNAVYVIDSANREMIVLRLDAGRRALDGIGYRSLEDDITFQPQR